MVLAIPSDLTVSRLAPISVGENTMTVDVEKHELLKMHSSYFTSCCVPSQRINFKP